MGSKRRPNENLNIYLWTSIYLATIRDYLIVHYSDVIISAMAPQITSVSIVCSAVCSFADLRKCQSSASLAFVRGIHRWAVNFPPQGPVTRKTFAVDDVIIYGFRWSAPTTPRDCRTMYVYAIECRFIMNIPNKSFLILTSWPKSLWLALAQPQNFFHYKSIYIARFLRKKLRNHKNVHPIWKSIHLKFTTPWKQPNSHSAAYCSWERSLVSAIPRFCCHGDAAFPVQGDPSDVGQSRY